jgi:hypothetical protein
MPELDIRDRYPVLSPGVRVPDSVIQKLNPNFDSTLEFSSIACTDKRLLQLGQDVIGSLIYSVLQVDISSIKK